MENKNKNSVKRKPISKKLRFEVFKRDNFTCQYCGRMAPDVILEVDHINPVANGGTNDILNLVTSCRDCNRGKGKKKIASKDEVKMQQEQLKELAEKREQLEMLIEWRKELEKLDEMKVDEVDKVLDSLCGCSFTEKGRKTILKYIEKYGLNEVCEATKIYVQSYFNQEERSFQKDINAISAICYNRKRQLTDPSIYWMNKIAYSVNWKYKHVPKWKVRKIIDGRIESEEQCEYILKLIAHSSTWGELRETLLEVL